MPMIVRGNLAELLVSSEVGSLTFISDDIKN
jgi:hypothetical protein